VKKGSCMNIDFDVPVLLVGMGLLNIPEDEPVKITVSLYAFY
jgi:hypothetical protein